MTMENLETLSQEFMIISALMYTSLITGIMIIVGAYLHYEMKKSENKQ